VKFFNSTAIFFCAVKVQNKPHSQEDVPNLKDFHVLKENCENRYQPHILYLVFLKFSCLLNQTGVHDKKDMFY